MSNSNETNALATIPLAIQTRAAAVPREQAEALLPAIQAVWPKDVAADPVLQRMVARIALAYGLDPLMGELTVYQGKPYVTIEGRMRKAQEHEQYRGLECRPATEEERQAFRCGPDDHLWRCEVYRADWPKPAVGWGRVNPKWEKENYVAKLHPQLMAEKRAKARALRDAFSIPLPSAEDAEDYSGPPQYVDATTGEISDTRPGGMLATQGQIAAIHALCKSLGISDDERHRHYAAMFQKTATNELTEGEAAAYLEFLAAVEAEEEAKRPEVIEAKLRESAYYVPDANGTARAKYATVPGWVTPKSISPDEPTEAEYTEVQANAENEGEPPEGEPAQLTRQDEIIAGYVGMVAEIEEMGAGDLTAKERKPRDAKVRDAILSLPGFDTEKLAIVLEQLTGKRIVSEVSAAQLMALEKIIRNKRTEVFAELV